MGCGHHGHPNAGQSKSSQMLGCAHHGHPSAGHPKSSQMLGNELWTVGIMVIPTPVIPNHSKSSQMLSCAHHGHTNAGHPKSSQMLGNELWSVGIMVIPTPVIPNHPKCWAVHIHYIPVWCAPVLAVFAVLYILLRPLVLYLLYLS